MRPVVVRGAAGLTVATVMALAGSTPWGRVLATPAPEAATRAQAAAPSSELSALWEQGRSFADFVAGARDQPERWRSNYERGEPTPDDVTRARQLARGQRLLVVAEDWCGDSVNTIPYVARLVEQVPGLQLRIIDSSVGSGVMKVHLTPDGRSATPTIVVIDERGAEAGALVERPVALQTWFLANEDEMPRRKLMDSKYRWYDDDRGRSTIRQVLDLLPVAGSPTLILEGRSSGTTALLQAISPAASGVIWASGHDGTWARSTDGGTSWTAGVVATAEQLQFRDVHAIDAESAYLMSAGSGDASRIYRTDDGGASWRLQFRNDSPSAFYDSFAFWGADQGIAFSDSVDGEHVLLRTSDGEHWQRIPPATLPAALPGEGCFAASGTCVITGTAGQAWVGTGAGTAARVLFTDDGGDSWVVRTTPIAAGSSAGIASLAFADAQRGAALGGDMGAPDVVSAGSIALTDDGGVTWRPGGAVPFAGAVYGAAFAPGTSILVAVGPGGIARSDDAGASWRHVDDRAHWAVAFASETLGWAVGPGGRITELRLAAAPAPQQAAADPPVTDISADDLLRRMASANQPIVLDVRTAEEFAEGHVPGAINIPHTEIVARADELRRLGDADIVLYCRSGRRAGLAGEELDRLGFERLLHLDGDMLQWQAEGRAIEKGPQR